MYRESDTTEKYEVIYQAPLIVTIKDHLPKNQGNFNNCITGYNICTTPSRIESTGYVGIDSIHVRHREKSYIESIH